MKIQSSYTATIMQKNEISRPASGGEAHTEREILSQPELWQEIYQLISKESTGIAGFLRPVLQKNNLRILLTGAGTSGYIG